MVPEVLSYSLDELVDRYPAALSFLASAGVDSDTLANLLSKAGWLKVESALRLCGVPPDALAQQIDAMDVPESLCASSDILAQLALYALLPCMLKVPVELALLRALQSSEPRGAFDRLCRFEWQDTLGLAELAHDCHDLSCFPDVVVSVGTHALFGRSFMDRFVRRGCFASVNLPEVDQALAGTGLSDPYGNFTMLVKNNNVYPYSIISMTTNGATFRLLASISNPSRSVRVTVSSASTRWLHTHTAREPHPAATSARPNAWGGDSAETSTAALGASTGATGSSWGPSVSWS